MRRGPALVAALLIAAGAAGAEEARDRVVAAHYAEPTARYPHGALGDEIEWGAMILETRGCATCEPASNSRRVIRLPPERVFEDTAPRLADVNGDGAPEAIVVESDDRLGARLAVYDAGGLVAATPFIGRRFRWLAPVGAADLDDDGRVEIAYVDRPHLARTLRVWRLEDGALVELAALGGVTNHRFGAPRIEGGIRRCGGVPEMIVADPGWTRLLAVRFDGAGLSSRDIGAFGPGAVGRAMACGP